MKKTTFTLALSAALLLGINFLAGCDKDEHTDEAPTLTIAEPTAGDSIALADNVHVEFTVADADELHELSVIAKSHMGDTVFSDYPTVHALKSYEYHEHFHATETGMHHLHINVSDHDGNVTSKEVVFYIVP